MKNIKEMCLDIVASTRKAWNEEPDRKKVYILLDKINTDLSKINGVKQAGSSDVNSYNEATIHLLLNPIGTVFHPNGQTYYGGFAFNFKTAKNLIAIILKKHDVEIIDIETPKKKYWLDDFGNSSGGYTDVSIHITVKLPYGEDDN